MIPLSGRRKGQFYEIGGVTAAALVIFWILTHSFWGGAGGALVMFGIALGAYFFAGGINSLFWIVVIGGGTAMGIVYAIVSGRPSARRTRTGWIVVFLVAVVLGILYYFFGTASPFLAFLIGIVFLLVLAMYLPPRMRSDVFSLHFFFFMATALLHLWLYANNYSIYLIILVGGFYVLPALLYYFEYSPQQGQREQVLVAFFLSLGMYLVPYALQQYLLPYLTSAFPYVNNIASVALDIVIFIVTMFPVWPLFILYRLEQLNAAGGRGGLAHQLLRAYRLFIIFAIVAVFLVNGLFQLPALAQRVLPGSLSGQVDAQSGFQGVVQSIKDTYAKVFDKGNALYNKATNPGSYYTGQVEDNKGKPLGVTVTDLRAIDNTIDNTTPVVVYGNVHALSFLGDKVTVTPTCTMDRTGSPAATVDPPVMDVIYGTSGTFQCTFPPLGKKGLYNVKSSVTFPFETWSYIQYQFVDEARALSLAQQGLNVRTVLDIKETPDATYTSGPVILGMGGTPQPILVRPDDAKDIIPQGTRVGLTIDKDWTGGKIDHVDQFQLKVPAPFELTDCDRPPSRTLPDANDPDYTSYEFDNPVTSALLSYTSLTCKLAIPLSEKAAARALVSVDKAPRSIIAVAKYTYTIDGTVAVRVG